MILWLNIYRICTLVEVERLDYNYYIFFERHSGLIHSSKMPVNRVLAFSKRVLALLKRVLAFLKLVLQFLKRVSAFFNEFWPFKKELAFWE